MQKSLLNSNDRARVEARVETLSPDSRKRWGRMSVEGMVCHLTDAFLAVLGDRPFNRQPRLHERIIMRVVALNSPFPWPHGVKTVPECDQESGGTPPGAFERDKVVLRSTLARFISEIDPDRSVHPIFGKMSPHEWGVWGYRHMDHHLRQFSA